MIDTITNEGKIKNTNNEGFPVTWKMYLKHIMKTNLQLFGCVNILPHFFIYLNKFCQLLLASSASAHNVGLQLLCSGGVSSLSLGISNLEFCVSFF